MVKRRCVAELAFACLDLLLDSGFDFARFGGGIVYALLTETSGNLYVGSSDVRMWNGSTWTNLGLTGHIYALTFDSAGNLYAGGNFNVPGKLIFDPTLAMVTSIAVASVK